MNTQTTFSKKFQFMLNNNKYILSLKAIIKDNKKILETKLTLILINSITHYYSEKTLEEIYNDYIFLTEFPSIESICEYFTKLIVNNSLRINNINNIIYKVIFNDASKNRNIKILLERKINVNEKEIEEIKIGMKAMCKNIQQMEDQLNNQNLKYKELEEKYQLLLQKFSEMEKRTDNSSINNNSENKSSNGNFVGDLKVLRSRTGSMGSIEFSQDQYKNSNNNNNIYDNKNDIDSQQIDDFDKSYSIYQSYKASNNNNVNNNNNNSSSKNISINESRRFQSQYSSINKEINSDVIKFLENNNEIQFKKNPTFIQQKYIINNNSKKEKDEIENFIAINNKNNTPIIAWITKNDNKTIYIMNINEKKKINKKEKAHDAKIYSIQYYNNDNIKTKNDYIISLSLHDIKTLKIWNIEIEDDINLKLVNIIEKKIMCFCLFSNKNYSIDNQFLISYIKDKNKKIISCWKLDNDFNIKQEEDWHKEITSSSEVNYLGIFYYKKDNEVYLINCNNNNVVVIRQPFSDNDYNENQIKSFKKSIIHLNAFLIERDKNLELFEANSEGATIWDYNNNNSPKKEFKIGTTFDICLWDQKYFWASTSSGFQLIDINDEEEINICIDANNNKKKRIGSKIRKIITAFEYESIVGIDSERQLCLWY